jgi:hypothetical protein
MEGICVTLSFVFVLEAAFTKRALVWLPELVGTVSLLS